MLVSGFDNRILNQNFWLESDDDPTRANEHIQKNV